MKRELLNILNKIYYLLMMCGWPEKAQWFKEKAAVIDALEQDSLEFDIEIKAIKKIISGMGSFTDLPLYPKTDSNLTEQEASNLQWELADKLGIEIKKLLTKSKEIK